MELLVSSNVKKLAENEDELFIFSGYTLVKIISDIIENPTNEKFRKIYKEVLIKLFCKAPGFPEILFSLGFYEKDDVFVLPEDISFDHFIKIKEEIISLLKERNLPHHPPQLFFKQNLNASQLQYPKPQNEQEMHILRTLLKQFSFAKLYEHPYLKKAAKDLMPLHRFFEISKTKNKHSLSSKFSSDENPCPLEILLMKLLIWFKEEFFQWFDKGYCERCCKVMKFVGYSSSTFEERLYGGHRVEKFACETCESTVRFPRYLHPLKLLETRKGRCMEWANCFTLMCRALGFEARYVLDFTDHAWTEVYLVSRKQWIHLDSTESKFDKPLMYETGWKKKLSYIFGVSKDEIVDCVWRYSANHRSVCKRRNSAREDWLASIITSLNEENQKEYDCESKKTISTRMVEEIASFFIEPKVVNGENEGRTSGSLAWRLARGETSIESGSFEPFVFRPSLDEIERKELIVKYTPSKDVYFREISDPKLQTMEGWKSGISRAQNMFRKHEKDWKMVYIARTEGSSEGVIAWKFDWGSTPLQIRTALIVFQHACFESGVVSWQICSDKDLCFQGNKQGVLEISKEDLEGSTYLELTATLKGDGEGDVVWQHSQLFRQREDDPHFPFFIKLKFD